MKYEPIPLPDAWYRHELHRLGHLADPDSRVEVADAVRSYQGFMGLGADGDLGPVTQASLRYGIDSDGNHRICGCPDILTEPGVEEVNISNGTRTWPDPEKPIILGLNFNTISGLNAEQVSASFNAAIRNINSSIGVRLQIGEWSDAHVRISRQRLSGSTLALALLSLGHRKIGGHYQRYDADRQWSQQMLQAVAIHETLHTLGFSHSSSRDSILYPTYNSRILTMQPTDIQRMGKYYPPLDNPEPPPEDPDPVPSGNFSMMGSIDGRYARLDGKLTFQ